MQTLSKGYKKPENGDTFDKVFPALALNVQLTNDHIHDGILGAITPERIVNFPPGGWTETPAASGNYVQSKDLGANYPVDTTTIQFRKSTGEAVYPTMEKVSTTVIKVTVNDSSLDLNAVYG